MSQPSTSVFRKNSAGSTQSDSKIIVSNKTKATQKVAPKDDLFKAQQQQVGFRNWLELPKYVG